MPSHHLRDIYSALRCVAILSASLPCPALQHRSIVSLWYLTSAWLYETRPLERERRGGGAKGFVLQRHQYAAVAPALHTDYWDPTRLSAEAPLRTRASVSEGSSWGKTRPDQTRPASPRSMFLSYRSQVV